ncbi:Protein of unknown function [Propionibacterium freudenreichii]|nr:Protein of unknown function [Propionibacterium freudenreichii]
MSSVWKRAAVAALAATVGSVGLVGTAAAAPADSASPSATPSSAFSKGSSYLPGFDTNSVRPSRNGSSAAPVARLPPSTAAFFRLPVA